MPEPIAAFSDVPASIEAVLTLHQHEMAELVDDRPLAAGLADRFVHHGMTAQLMTNTTLGPESTHHIVQALGEEDIFYIDPAWMVVGERVGAEVPDDAGRILCYRTWEVPVVASWFSTLVAEPEVPIADIEAIAAQTWDPLNYKAVGEPRVIPEYNL